MKYNYIIIFILESHIARSYFAFSYFARKYHKNTTKNLKNVSISVARQMDRDYR